MDHVPEPERLEQLMLQQASAVGALAPGGYRVVVLEGDGRLTARDFDALTRAVEYADDAASEAEGNAPVARVFDHALRIVHEGRAFWARARR